MAGIEIGEDVPVRVVRVMHGHLDLVAGLVGVFFHRETVVLMGHRLAELPAVRFRNFDLPLIHFRIG